MTTLRGMSTVIGLALLGASAHVNVLAGGGYTSAHSVVTLSVAAGVGVGALAIGSAWGQGRRALAIAIFVALIAGEAFGLILTAERLIHSRDALQAPLLGQQQIASSARERLAKAEGSLAMAKFSSPRLEAALSGKAAADKAVQGKAAEKGCAAHCRALLDQQVAAGAAEVLAARADADKLRHDAEVELEAARLAWANSKAPASASPLADRLGVPGWILDLVTAALGSIAANGLGGLLLAFAGHNLRRETTSPSVPVTSSVQPLRLASPQPESPPTFKRAKSRQIRSDTSVSAFAAAALFPATGERVGVADVYRSYRLWCQARDGCTLEADAFGEAFARLVKRLGLGVEMVGGAPVLQGVTLFLPTPATDRERDEVAIGGNSGTVSP